MIRKHPVFAVALLVLLLAVTTIVAFASRDWVEAGTLIIYPEAETITHYDEIIVEYEYRFLEEAGVASAVLIGYQNNNCGGGNDRWGGRPVSPVASKQTPALEGFAKLILRPDTLLLTPEIGSVTVEIHLKETNHEMKNRVDFYCRVVDHNATEAAAQTPEDAPSLETLTDDSRPITLHAISPGHVINWQEGPPYHFGTARPGLEISADISYNFQHAIGEARVFAYGMLDSCYSHTSQKPITKTEQYVIVSDVVIGQGNDWQNRESFTIKVNDQLPSQVRSVMLTAELWENGKRGKVNSQNCFDLEDHTIDLLNIAPGAVLDATTSQQTIGTISPNEAVTANMRFTFDTVPGKADVRLMGRNGTCESWLFNPGALAFPTDSYAVSSTSSQTFNALENTTVFTLSPDQLRPTTRSVYLEARTFENGVQTEHNVFLSCSNVAP